MNAFVQRMDPEIQASHERLNSYLRGQKRAGFLEGREAVLGYLERRVALLEKVSDEVCTLVAVEMRALVEDARRGSDREPFQHLEAP